LHIVLQLVFFFSSRRRHTRFSRDWSSDVCSSDLFRLPIPRILQMLSYFFMVCNTSSVISLGWEVENLTLRSGATRATISSRWAKFTTSETSFFLFSLALLFSSGDHL